MQAYSDINISTRNTSAYHHSLPYLTMYQHTSSQSVIRRYMLDIVTDCHAPPDIAIYGPKCHQTLNLISRDCHTRHILFEIVIHCLAWPLVIVSLYCHQRLVSEHVAFPCPKGHPYHNMLKWLAMHIPF